MTEIAIVRAAHLQVYLEELRAIGVPIESKLARSRLPHWILDDRNAYVSMALCLDWLAICSRDVELMDFGFRSARRGSLASLNAPFRQALLDAPTGFARFQAFSRHASLEDNVLSTRMQREGDQTRVISSTAGFESHPSFGLAEWIDLQAMISIVRSVAGPRWRPQEMTFVSRQQPSIMVQETFQNTRILVGQPWTSILVNSVTLAGPGLDGAGAADQTVVRTEASPDSDQSEWSLPTVLGAAVRPYLANGYPSLAEMAETLGVSARTLQRRLQQSSRSYSDVVQEARFGLARELLVDPSVRIMDVALAAGYDNQQHFARAFRRIAGVSPRSYRRSLAEVD